MGSPDNLSCRGLFHHKSGKLAKQRVVRLRDIGLIPASSTILEELNSLVIKGFELFLGLRYLVG
jgi:hypothetical protein